MAQTQNYEVYYDIKVNATEGTEQVTAFANAVEKLSKGRISFAPVVTNINEMMQAVEKTSGERTARRRISTSIWKSEPAKRKSDWKVSRTC